MMMPHRMANGKQRHEPEGFGRQRTASHVKNPGPAKDRGRGKTALHLSRGVHIRALGGRFRGQPMFGTKCGKNSNVKTLEDGTADSDISLPLCSFVN